MFFVLSKTISIFLMPIYWLIGLFLLFLFSKKRKKLYMWAFICCFLLLTNPLIINTLLLGWEIKPTPLKNLEGKYDVGIVLTGITNYTKSPKDRTYLGEGADRIMHALMLYRQGKIEKILITGGTIALSGKEYTSEASELKRVLLHANVPEADIILEEKARNTRENALFAKKILDQQFPKKRYLLITSAFHMRRAWACFQRAEVEVTPFSAGVLTHDFQFLPWAQLFPTERSLSLWNTLVHEILGYLTYKVIGYA
jgi:uncharacterized SAM-binding protein YcdF (DUF218 family)